MAPLTIYRDSYVDSTVVSNKFIDEYMKDANDAQLKVYLYLLRILGTQQTAGVSDIADKFNHTEKDILRAFRYWEKKKLLALDFDGDNGLVGIHLLDLCRAGALQEEPLFPIVKLTVPPAEESPQDSFVKPAYTLDQLKEFKGRQDTAQLLFITETYIGKPLTPGEIKTILFLKDILGFSDDLIDYLIQFCVDKGKKDFKYIEKVAVNWAEEGVRTPKQAQKLSARYDKNVYAIMNELGKGGSPTSKELEYITRWTRDYGFTNDIIFEACERTVMATDKHRFEYAEGILSNWKKENVRNKADIRRIDDLYQQKRRNSPKAVPANKFNQFPQNQYDFNQLERELLSN